MIFEKIKSEGIAHNSYLIGSEKEAAVVDPRRDCDIYLKIAKKHDLRIEHIFETHRNEDYVIGSLELSHLVGAEIHHGSNLDFAYGKSTKEGDRFEIGMLELEVIETPGHTDESISITLKNREVSDDIYMVFTGDTLFAGEVGRTDLYGEDRAEEMSEKLYDSIFKKILLLGDNVILCPAHGAGSVCGADISKNELTTIGYEKKTNLLLQKSKKEFVAYKLNERLYRPPYFRKMEKHNKEGPPILHKFPYLKPLDIEQLKEYRKNCAQIVDIRMPTSYACGHIPGSINIWEDGLPAFVGWFLNYKDPIIIIHEGNLKLDRALRYFIRLGYDNIHGYLAGGFFTWYVAAEEIEKINTWSVQELKKHRKEDSIFILDVRDINNWEKNHIEGSHHIYVGHLKKHLDEIPREKNIVVICDSGFKTSIASSILKMHGYEKVTNVLGGMMAWKNAGYSAEGE